MQNDSIQVIATGRHATVLAVLGPAGHHSRPSVIKLIHGPRSGRSLGSEPHDIVKEARLLQELSHPNVISLLEYEFDADLFEHRLHLPLLAFPLRDLLDVPNAAVDEVIRSATFQVLLALAHLHGKGIAHRDIKPNNVMFDWDGTVKLIDFGTAWTGGDVDREEALAWHETSAKMCCGVGTGHHRAPELLFSPTTYDPFALDMWSLGVMIADFYLSNESPDGPDDDDDDDVKSDLDPLEDPRTPSPDRSNRRARLFDDTFGEVGLAASIFRVLGSPTPESWPDFRSLPDAGKIDFVPTPARLLGDVLATTSVPLLALNQGLLRLSPAARLTAQAALDSTWFDCVLVPSDYQARYGDDPRSDLSDRCVHAIDGVRLVDFLADELKLARQRWPNAEGERGS